MKLQETRLFFLGSDFKEVLLKHFDPDCLIEAYGGTSKYEFDPSKPTEDGQPNIGLFSLKEVK